MPVATILKNATDERLGLAVFENLYDLFRAMADTLPDSQLVEQEGFSRPLTFPTNPMFKGVWNTHLSEQGADSAIDGTIAWFKEQNAPYFFWWTGGNTSPSDLESRLAQHGMISMAEQTRESARRLHSGRCSMHVSMAIIMRSSSRRRWASLSTSGLVFA